MYEFMSPEKMKIKKFLVESSNEKRSPFNFEKFITWADRQVLQGILPHLQSTEIVEKLSWDHFDRTLVSASIVLPDEIKKFKPDENLFSRMASADDILYMTVFTDRSNACRILNHLASIKILFPEKLDQVSRFERHKKQIPLAINNVASILGSPTEDLSTYMASAILSPDYFDKLPPYPENEETIEKALHNIDDVINDPNMRIYPESQLIDWNLIVKLLYPNHKKDMRIDKIHWNLFAKELRHDLVDSSTFWGRLARAKLLLADEIQYTEKGIITKFEETNIDNKNLDIPKRRLF